MRLAIVIPTLNEEEALPAVFTPAFEAADEICVSDGESTDRTREIARSLGAQVVVGPAGRGPQLNRGARATASEILLFLHADTRLPDDAIDRIRHAIADGALGGGFLIRFEPAKGILPLSQRVANLRTRLSGCPLGDQAQFVHRNAFEALEGYNDWPILEDLDFARRLRRHGRTVLLDPPVTTSARRYLARGIVRAHLTNWLIFGLYFLGVSPRRLARLYR